MNYFTPFVHIHNQQKEQTRQLDKTRERSETAFSTEVNRLLSAAVINQRFCNLLLSDPLRAITLGFNGEAFAFSAEEKSLLLAIHANTLQSFAEQVAAINGAQRKADLPVDVHRQHLPETAPGARAQAKFRTPKPTISLSS